MAVGGWSGGWLVRRSVTLCSSALEPATDKFNTVLEMGQIAYEDLAIKNQICINLLFNYLFIN